MSGVIPEVSVVLATKSRKDDLRRALASVVSQEGIKLEVIVVDDGSNDGTSDMVRHEFPSVRLERREVSKGVAARRTEGAELARASIVFSIDDDAAYTTPYVIRDTVPEFDHPRIGAVAVPHVDVMVSPNLLFCPPDIPGRWIVSSFVGTAYAVRRDVFLSLGGYRSILVHSTEERDFCVRMLNRGYVVRVGSSDPVHHYSSPIRNARVARMLERRNDICHAVWDVPFPQILGHLPGTIASGLLFGLKRGCLAPTLEGYWKAPGVCWRGRSNRNPITCSVYELLRRLKSKTYLRMEEVESFLPPLPETLQVTANR